MMKFSYNSQNGWDDSVDSVFCDDDFYPPDYFPPNSAVCSPNNAVFYLDNSARSLHEGHSNVYSPNANFHTSNSVREVYSPTVSNYSTYSQEVKYIFDPDFGKMQQRSRSHSNIKLHSTPAQFEPIDNSGNSTEDDYSQIQHNRKPSLQRKPSNSNHQRVQQGQLHVPVPGQGHGTIQGHSQGHSKNPPPPPPRTCSSMSASHLSQQQDDGTLTQRKASLSHSMSASYNSYYYPQSQGRRKTWSPEGLRIYNSVSAKRSQRLRSVSNEQLLEPAHNVERPLTYDNNNDRDHIYEQLETGPPKLAPISGMLNRVCLFCKTSNPKALNDSYLMKCIPFNYKVLFN